MNGLLAIKEVDNFTIDQEALNNHHNYFLEEQTQQHKGHNKHPFHNYIEPNHNGYQSIYRVKKQ